MREEFAVCDICGCKGPFLSCEPKDSPETETPYRSSREATGRHSTATISTSPIDGLLVCEDCSVIQLQRCAFTPHEPHEADATSSCIACFRDAYELWHSEDERIQCGEECSQCGQLEDSLDLRWLAINIAARRRFPWPFSENWNPTESDGVARRGPGGSRR